ncbi:MAG TPA: NAD(P)/FAD-dependent oxidoreductase, partial [Patescibacteria group bacterium]|nr:NAD(P)/FAD-dependent oxidoreductase [Patescibacteria group bacterium]
GWLPTDRHTLQVGGRSNVFALGDATDLPLSKAGSTAHFEAPVVVEGILAGIEGRQPAGKHALYEGRVMCFFEVGDGKGTLLRFDYDHPPKPPKPNALWHIGKIVFNKTYFHTVPRGRV